MRPVLTSVSSSSLPHIHACPLASPPCLQLLCLYHLAAGSRLEGMDDLLEQFFAVVAEFRAQGHNLLDFENQSFDRNYVGFNVKVSDLETRLQAFINHAFSRITSIQASFELLERLQLVLQARAGLARQHNAPTRVVAVPCCPRVANVFDPHAAL